MATTNVSGLEGTTGTGGGDHQVLWPIFDNLVQILWPIFDNLVSYNAGRADRSTQSG